MESFETFNAEQNIEKEPLTTYMYFVGIPGEENPPIFSCDATNPEEADDKFKEEMGKTPEEIKDLIIATGPAN